MLKLGKRPSFHLYWNDQTKTNLNKKQKTKKQTKTAVNCSSNVLTRANVYVPAARKSSTS